MYDAAGDDVATADDTVNRAVQLTITAPAGADYDDSVILDAGSGSALEGILISSSNADTLADTQIRPAGSQTWDQVLAADGAGNYTLTARLLNTTNGAVLSTSTITVTVTSAAGAPAASVLFLNGSGNVIGNIGVGADDSIASNLLATVNSTGGPYVILDDSISFTSNVSSLNLGTSPSASTATNYGVFAFVAGTGNNTGAAGTKTLTASVVPVATSVGTGSLVYNVGTEAPASGSTVVLTTTPQYDTTSGADDTWQVPPGTSTLTFSFALTNAAASSTVPWNATSSAVGGGLAPAGGAATVTVDSGTITLAANAAASASGKVVALTLGAAGDSNKKTVWVVFTAPTATVDTSPPIAKISTAAPIPGTITDQYGAALPGTWAIRLLNGASQSCSAALTPIATTTASATGAFEVTVPAAFASATAGNATYTVCASNGFSTASANSTVTFTATGGVVSLTSLGYLASSTQATSLPVVQVPGTGVVNLNNASLTSTQQSASTALTAATIAGAGTAFRLTATVNPVAQVTFSGTDGVMFTEATAGSILWSAGSSTATVLATAGSGSSGTSTVSVYATKPGTHVVTMTAGTTTTTFSFKAGVARGSIRQITPIPTSITLKPNEFKATTVKATDIYGNAVPDDSSITAALAGGGTIAPVAGTVMTTDAAGVVTVYYTAPLGTGTGKLVWTAGTYVSGTIAGAPAAVYTTATDIVVSDGGSGDKTIVIVGERGTVSGKPGIIVDGATTGLETGKTVIPYVRFPGGEYTQGTARPAISAAGDFEWSRKTGKKSYVYFTNDDGAVTSNRIIIAAN